MKARINYFKVAPDLSSKYRAFSTATKTKAVVRELEALVTIRASQLNGCGFCLDMHVKAAKIAGEGELHLHHVAIWRESTLFSDRQRAALEWTEALTHLPPHGVSDELYERMRHQFSEEELCDLTFLVMAINGWNRISVALRAVPGSADAEYGLDKARFN